MDEIYRIIGAGVAGAVIGFVIGKYLYCRKSDKPKQVIEVKEIEEDPTVEE